MKNSLYKLAFGNFGSNYGTDSMGGSAGSLYLQQAKQRKAVRQNDTPNITSQRGRQEGTSNAVAAGKMTQQEKQQADQASRARTTRVDQASKRAAPAVAVTTMTAPLLAVPGAGTALTLLGGAAAAPAAYSGVKTYFFGDKSNSALNAYGEAFGNMGLFQRGTNWLYAPSQGDSSYSYSMNQLSNPEFRKSNPAAQRQYDKYFNPTTWNMDKKRKYTNAWLKSGNDQIYSQYQKYLQLNPNASQQDFIQSVYGKDYNSYMQSNPGGNMNAFVMRMAIDRGKQLYVQNMQPSFATSSSTDYAQSLYNPVFTNEAGHALGSVGGYLGNMGLMSKIIPSSNLTPFKTFAASATAAGATEVADVAVKNGVRHYYDNKYNISGLRSQYDKALKAARENPSKQNNQRLAQLSYRLQGAYTDATSQAAITGQGVTGLFQGILAGTNTGLKRMPMKSRFKFLKPAATSAYFQSNMLSDGMQAVPVNPNFIFDSHFNPQAPGLSYDTAAIHHFQNGGENWWQRLLRAGAQAYIVNPLYDMPVSNAYAHLGRNVDQRAVSKLTAHRDSAYDQEAQ